MLPLFNPIRSRHENYIYELMFYTKFKYSQMKIICFTKNHFIQHVNDIMTGIWGWQEIHNMRQDRSLQSPSPRLELPTHVSVTLQWRAGIEEIMLYWARFSQWLGKCCLLQTPSWKVFSYCTQKSSVENGYSDPYTWRSVFIGKQPFWTSWCLAILPLV